MPYNAVNFKKAMLAWEATVKKAVAEITKEANELQAEEPGVSKQLLGWAKLLGDLNEKIGDQLDNVLNAKNDQARAPLMRTALGTVKQCQSWVNSVQLPPEIKAPVAGGIQQLTRALS